VGNECEEVGGGADGDFALAGAAESLRSGVLAQVVTSYGVVLRGVR